MRTSASNSSLRARTKLEALDNLVISTIYGMSAKIRSNAESLMRKLRCVPTPFVTLTFTC